VSTAPGGRRCVVNAHNAYVDAPDENAEGNLTATLALVHAAQQRGADAIELDVHVQGGTWYVAHDARPDLASHAAPLEGVLADPALRSGDQLLFIEIKTRRLEASHVAGLMDLLVRRGHARTGRPAVLRSFVDREGHRRALAVREAAPREWRECFRIHALCAAHTAPDTASFRALVREVAGAGHDGIEFETATVWTPDVVDLAALARSLGLCAGQWTIQEASPRFGDGAIWAQCFRGHFDALTTDHDVAAVRAAVAGPGPLVPSDTAADATAPDAGAPVVRPGGGFVLSALVGLAGGPGPRPATILVEQPGSLRLELDAGALRFAVRSGGDWTSLAAPAGLVGGPHGHLVVALAGRGRLELLVDGERRASAALTGALERAAPAPLCVARPPWRGRIEHVELAPLPAAATG
jgi:glycerophosphoryl diester phosphodiesterase